MLEINLCGNFMEVKESIHGFNRTKITYWYYDINNWIKSIKGERNEIPSQKMTINEINWVKKYYIPKAKTHVSLLEGRING